jgi:opacity protein-like surface antigen
MKKSIISIVLFFLFSYANAQTKSEGHFGIKLGFNYADITNSGGSPIVSYHLGVFLKYKVSDKIGIQPELLISGQGVKVYNGEFYFKYINAPLLFKYYATKKFNLEFGPQLCFLYSAESKAFGANATVDVSNRVNNNDYSLVFGAGYDVDKNISIDLRYNIGLSQVQSNLAPNESASKNSVFQFSLGYKF